MNLLQRVGADQDADRERRLDPVRGPGGVGTRLGHQSCEELPITADYFSNTTTGISRLVFFWYSP